MHKKYIAAYMEVDTENLDNVALSLKQSMKSELFDATGKTQYPVYGDGYTGGVVVVQISSMDAPEDLESFKQKIEADYIAMTSDPQTAEEKVMQKRDA